MYHEYTLNIQSKREILPPGFIQQWKAKDYASSVGCWSKIVK